MDRHYHGDPYFIPPLYPAHRGEGSYVLAAAVLPSALNSTFKIS